MAESGLVAWSCVRDRFDLAIVPVPFRRPFREGPKGCRTCRRMTEPRTHRAVHQSSLGWQAWRTCAMKRFVSIDLAAPEALSVDELERPQPGTGEAHSRSRCQRQPRRLRAGAAETLSADRPRR